MKIVRLCQTKILNYNGFHPQIYLAVVPEIVDYVEHLTFRKINTIGFVISFAFDHRRNEVITYRYFLEVDPIKKILMEMERERLLKVSSLIRSTTKSTTNGIEVIPYSTVTSCIPEYAKDVSAVCGKLVEPVSTLLIG